VRSAARHKIGHRGQNEKFLLDMHSIGVRYRPRGLWAPAVGPDSDQPSKNVLVLEVP
jgi:hypothetical protein